MGALKQLTASAEERCASGGVEGMRCMSFRKCVGESVVRSLLGTELVVSCLLLTEANTAQVLVV